MPHKHLCEAPDHEHLKHPAHIVWGSYMVVAGPRWSYWFFACKEYLDYIRDEIAMGRSNLAIHKWKGH